MIVFRSLLALVVLAPLPLASVYVWSWGLMASIVGVLLVGWAFSHAHRGEQPPVAVKSIWPFVVLFGVTVLWALIQSLPLTPESWHHPIWNTASEALGRDLRGSVSLNPYATRSALLRLLTYGGIFWLSLQYCRSSTRARHVIFMVPAAGALYSIYGLIVQFSGSQTILWFDKYAYKNDLTSTFVNRNSFATFAGLTLLCASGLLLDALRKSLGGALGWRDGLHRLLNTAWPPPWILLVACIVIATALLLSHSRGGFISTGAGLLTLCLIQGITREARLRFALSVTVVAVVAGTLLFAVGGEGTDQRLARISVETQERPLVYEKTVEAIEAAPVLGTGYGTFEEVFRFYRDESLRSFYMEAHNTYLENGLELGLPGAFALFATIGGLAVLTLCGVRRRYRNAIFPCIGFAVTVQVGIHAMVDFSLQIPAVAAFYSLVMGAACAQSWSSREHTGR